MTFSNPIVAGEELIRSAINSENYVAGTSGWRIARDGNAEFLDVTVRGDLLVVGDTPPDEYLRIYQALGVPTLEWSDELGHKWEMYASASGNFPFLKITNSANLGMFLHCGGEDPNFPSGAILFTNNRGERGVIYNPNTKYLSVVKGIDANDYLREEVWTTLPLANG